MLRYVRPHRVPWLQLALAPLAMASLAVDVGMGISVESDYTPRWLVEDQRP